MTDGSSSSVVPALLKTFTNDDSSETVITVKSVSSAVLSAVLCLVPVWEVDRESEGFK